MRKTLLLMLGLATLMGGTFAQNPLIRTDLIPPSPTAGSIAKAGEVPLNLSSGLPSLSIPIYTVQGQELSLPISLNYNYDGFKPAQPASWVGLGWNLEAGGVIIRSIRDKVDGTMGVGNYNGDTVQNVLYSASEPSQHFLKWAPMMYDLEPDEYSFNFAGYSGKFIIHNDRFYIYPSQKLKITGGVSGFVITTENGNKYYFDALETTNPKGSPGAPYNLPSSYNSAYYLSKVENAAATEKILLAYTGEGKISNNGSATQTWRRDLSLFVDYSTPPSPSLSYPTYVNTLRLSTITTEKQTVVFVPGNVRTDINQSAGGYAMDLERIDISSKTKLIKQFKLGHSYGGGGLMLDYVKDCPVIMIDEETGPFPDTLTHSFEYESAGSYSHPLAAVDHFGFSNGSGDFTGMMIPNTIHPNGVNREPSLAGTIQGALKTITYPSGGSTSFNYQLNVRSNGVEYEHDNHSVSSSVTRPNTGSATLNSSYTPFFTINETQTVQVLLQRTPYTEQGDGIAHNATTDFQVIQTGTSTVMLENRIGYESENAGKTFTVTLGPGTYYITTAADFREAYISATLSYYTLSNRPVEGAPSGGLRVASMTTMPLAGTPLYREFKYTNAQGFSTGVAPINGYHQAPFEEITTGPGSLISKNYTVYSSYVSEAPATSLPHYYTSVLEKQIGGTDTLFTRHEFRAFDYVGMGTAPTKVTQYRKNSSGTLMPATVKGYEYVQVQDTLFRKMKAFQTMQVIILPGGMWAAGPTETHDHTDNFLALGWKYLKSTRDVVYEGTDSLVTVTNNSYDGNRNLAYTSTTGSTGEMTTSRMKYPESYDGDFAFMTNSHIVSPVIEQQSWNKLGTDSVLVSGALTEYSTTLYKPIKQYLLTGQGITSLNNESKTGALYNNFMSDSRYEERASYTYNGTGRLTSQQLTGGPPTSYQWGYAAIVPYGYTSLGQLNYPIAEVRNALPTEFYTENFEEHGSATAGTANTGDKYYNGDFYVNWSIPNARSYVISFSYRSAGKWHYKTQAYTGATTLTDGDAIDDVAIYPTDAQLSSLTYFDGIGNRSMIDAKGLKMDYEYDQLNRLLNIRDQNGDIVKNYRYNYGNANGFYYNTAQTATFTRNNCSSGLLGTKVAYTVPANTYSSTTSQAAADALAVAALAGNGQAYANANGTCVSGVAVSFIDYTYAPFQGYISQLQVKDSGGNVLYTFNQSQVIAGFSIPQGTYTLSFTMADLNPGSSWGTCSISSSSGYQEFYSVGSSVYNISGVVLTASTATISLYSEIY